MKYTALQIADFLTGQIEGDPKTEVYKVDKIDKADHGALSFLANPKYTKFIYDTKASIVLVSNDFVPEKKVKTTMIRVEDPYSAFAKILEMYQQNRLNKSGISKKASIEKSAKLGKNIYIGDFVHIGDDVVIGSDVKIFPQVYVGDNVKIDDNTIIYPGVKIYADTVIGKSCIIHSGVVLGADGFGFVVQDDNKYKKVPQTGNVILEDRVEIGANTAIDKATLGSTIIRSGVKIDNLIQIAHNVEIGRDTVIAAQTGISGSTKIGSRCLIAGQVGFVGHIDIADEVKIGAQSGVSSSIKDKGAAVMGSPAFDASIYRRVLVLFKRLPDIVRRLQKIENALFNKSN